MKQNVRLVGILIGQMLLQHLSPVLLVYLLRIQSLQKFSGGPGLHLTFQFLSHYLLQGNLLQQDSDSCASQTHEKPVQIRAGSRKNCVGNLSVRLWNDSVFLQLLFQIPIGSRHNQLFLCPGHCHVKYPQFFSQIIQLHFTAQYIFL